MKLKQHDLVVALTSLYLARVGYLCLEPKLVSQTSNDRSVVKLPLCAGVSA